MIPQAFFEYEIAKCFQGHGHPNRWCCSQAKSELNGWLETMEIDYGDPEYTWTEADAREIAKECMSYWAD